AGSDNKTTTEEVYGDVFTPRANLAWFSVVPVVEMIFAGSRSYDDRRVAVALNCRTHEALVGFVDVEHRDLGAVGTNDAEADAVAIGQTLASLPVRRCGWSRS